MSRREFEDHARKLAPLSPLKISRSNFSRHIQLTASLIIIGDCIPRAAAAVTDIGAPLSHAAIVARELGIPAVVGCGDATTRLKTGDRVRLDGARGTVEILD